MKRGSPEHNESMLRVAQLYYEHGLTQDEIGHRLLLTRWKVGRLLEEARDAGIVRIEIVHPQARRHEDELEIKQRFGLRDVVVVPERPDERDQRTAVARAAAEFLCDIQPSPKTLGVSWGHTLDEVAAAMPSGWTRGVRVLQINGAISRSHRPTSAADVASTIARQGAGTVTLLPAPAIVEKAETRSALEGDPAVREVLTSARAAPVLLFSLGALSERSVLVDSGYLTPPDIQRLRTAGATGDVLGRFIGSDGSAVDPQLEQRTIGLTLEDIRRAPWSIAVASGTAKADVTRAVVASGLCTVLVTDQHIASHLMKVL